MNLHTSDTWTRRGLTLLWHAADLSKVCKTVEVVSVRAWLTQYSSSGETLPSNQGRALVVAGLGAVLDSAGPEEAAQWLASVFKPAVNAFGRRPGEPALVFWLPEGKHRIVASVADDRYQWKLDPKGQVSLLTVFGGAEADLERIAAAGTHVASADGDAWHGLYIRRIS